MDKKSKFAFETNVCLCVYTLYITDNGIPYEARKGDSAIYNINEW